MDKLKVFINLVTT